MKKTLKLVQEFRKADEDTPIVLMGYYNPIYVYGVDKFLMDAKAAGADGFIIVDLPPEEDDEFCIPALKAGHELHPPRHADHRRQARAHRVQQHQRLRLLRLGARHHRHQGAGPEEREGQCQPPGKHTPLPICVGFGVKTAEQARAIAKDADGVVVGSALVSAVEKSLTKAGKPTSKTAKAVHALVSEIAQGVRS